MLTYVCVKQQLCNRFSQFSRLDALDVCFQFVFTE